MFPIIFDGPYEKILDYLGLSRDELAAKDGSNMYNKYKKTPRNTFYYIMTRPTLKY